MSRDRLSDYTGRHWAIKINEGGWESVHHFESMEMRNAWVDMDPERRRAVSPFHRYVRRWLKEDPAYVSPWGRFWNWVAKIGKK